MKDKKNFLLCFLFKLVVTTTLSNAQNLLNNSSFVSCKTDVTDCSGGEGKFERVKDWHSFGSGDHFGLDLSNGPDWGTDGVASLGTVHVAGIFEDEGIYYDMGTSGFKTGIYHLSFYTKGDAENGTISADPVNGISVYLCTGPPSPGGCTDFEGGTEYEIYRSAVPLGSSYTKIDVDFKVFNADVPFRYLTFCTYRNGKCDRYMLIAAPTLTMNCCGDYMLYQDCDYLPDVTQRTEYIEAGKDIGCIWQPTGPVTVKADQNVTFQASWCELHPGFSTENGAVFEMKTGDCSSQDYSDAEMHFNEKYRTTAAFPTCDQLTGNGFFAATGVSYYRVQIYDRWDEKIFDDIQWVHEIYWQFWNGTNTFTDNMIQDSRVVLQFYNCNLDTLDDFALHFEYVYPCKPEYAKKEADSIQNYITLTSDIGISIFPNPSKNNITILFSKMVDTSVKIFMIDQLGRIVLSKLDKINSINNRIEVDVSDIASGIYDIHISGSSEFYSQKVIIIK